MSSERGHWDVQDCNGIVESDEHQSRSNILPSSDEEVSVDNSDIHSSGSDVSCVEEMNRSPTTKPLVLKNVCHKQLTKKRKPREKAPSQKISVFNFMQEDRSLSESRDTHFYSVYITSHQQSGEQDHINSWPDKFKNYIKDIVRDRYRLQTTSCGLIAFFVNEDDIERVLKLKLAEIFGIPIQVIRFPKGEITYKRYVLVKDVPWCISVTEIRRALKMQGIVAGLVCRNRVHIRVELFNSCDVERLTQEGLNFYNCTAFPAVIENAATAAHVDQNIVQCYNCQGFWHTSSHCRFQTKCVRCGENHDVENCPRGRNDPICCHCGGPHHAAYKHCPVRLQHLSTVQIAFSLAKNRPRRQYHFLK